MKKKTEIVLFLWFKVVKKELFPCFFLHFKTSLMTNCLVWYNVYIYLIFTKILHVINHYWLLCLFMIYYVSVTNKTWVMKNTTERNKITRSKCTRIYLPISLLGINILFLSVSKQFFATIWTIWNIIN